MEGESGVSPNIIDELHSWDIQRDQREGESAVTRRIIHELSSWVIQGEQMVGPIVLMEVSLMNLLLHISKEAK